MLTTIEIPSKSPAIYSIIWLHGLGADGHDFESIASELSLMTNANVRFIFPNAPIRPVTVNGGMKMRAWYDIVELSLQVQVDSIGIYESAEQLSELIREEQRRGIASENIMLAGFSQGGVIALHAGLKYPQRLAGILALSTYLPTVGQLEDERSTANDNIPIFMAHGILDTIVPIETAKMAHNALQKMGYPIQWHDYLMEHSVCIEEILHISDFINHIFKE